MLPWTTLPATWRCAKPLAALSAILIRLSQSSGVRPEPLLPAKQPTHSSVHHGYFRKLTFVYISGMKMMHFLKRRKNKAYSQSYNNDVGDYHMVNDDDHQFISVLNFSDFFLIKKIIIRDIKNNETERAASTQRMFV